MNKLFATIILAAFALSSCIKGDDSYKEFLPVQPGANIHNMTMTQNSIAMQPANAGIRLAMLLAEAAKQHPGMDLKEVDLTKLTIEDTNYSVLTQLFTAGTKIERQANGDYKITYDVSYQQPDGLFLEGSMLVKTNGTEQLKDTHGGSAWEVEIVSGLKLKSANSSTSQMVTVNMEGGTTMLYANGNGTYAVEMQGIGAKFENTTTTSSWTGDFTLSGEDAGLIYSECRGKDFKFSGSASGGSVYVGSDNSRLSLGYVLSGGVYRGYQIIEGTQDCRFESYNFDFTAYPSPEVKYVWSNQGNQIYQKIYYNGHVYPKN